MTKKFDRVLSDDWLPLEFQSGNSVPVTSVLVNLRTLKSIVEQTEQAVLQSPEIQALRQDAELWGPIISEIHRRAEKEHAMEDRCDFTVTIDYEDYAAIVAAKEQQS